MDSDDAIDGIYRRRHGQVLAAVWRSVAPAALTEVEPVVQDAFMRAIERWSRDGMPDNPVAWLIRVARNRFLDDARRRQRSPQPQLDTLLPDAPAPDATLGSDDMLQLLFVCCATDLSQPSRILLALRHVCGLGTAELATLFWTDPAALDRRLRRARRAVGTLDPDADMPAATMRSHSGDVIAVIYALHSGGFGDAADDPPNADVVCREALRLARLVDESRHTASPRSAALLALVLLTGARLPARTDADGAPLALDEQDRNLWRRDWIAEGLSLLPRIQQAPQPHAIAVESGIAACHATAADFMTTDWARVAALYDVLRSLDPSPVVAVNHAVAVGLADRPETGLAMLSAIADAASDAVRHQWYAAKGFLLARDGDTEAAISSYRTALDLAPRPAQRAGLAKRLKALEAGP